MNGAVHLDAELGFFSSPGFQAASVDCESPDAAHVDGGAHETTNEALLAAMSCEDALKLRQVRETPRPKPRETTQNPERGYEIRAYFA